MTDEEPEYDVKEVQVSTGRKMQLEQYEPINEQVTLTAVVPNGENADAVTEALERQAWEATERGLMRRYEEQMRQDEE